MKTMQTGTFTDYELAEWPALALLVGPHQPLPLDPKLLVMRQNVSDEVLGTGMVASGYAYDTLVEAILFGLVAKYRLPGHDRWLTLEDAIDFARMNLDGKVVPPGVSSMMRRDADAAVRQIQDHLLDERFTLCLGDEFHDLDLEEDQEYLYRQHAADRAAQAKARAERVLTKAEVTEVERTVVSMPPPRGGSFARLTLADVGDVLVAAPDEPPQCTVVETMRMAFRYGWSNKGQAFKSLKALVLKSGDGPITNRQQLMTLYSHLPAALQHLDMAAAPEGCKFEYAYGTLALLTIAMPYPKPGVIIDFEGFDSVEQMALEIIDWARMCGRKTSGSWRRWLWRQDFEAMSDWQKGPDPLNILDAADRALDWLNENFARSADHIFEVAPNGSFILTDHSGASS